MDEPRNDQPTQPEERPGPLILLFRVFRIEERVVLLHPGPRPAQHRLVLGLSKVALLRLAKICLELVEELPADPRAVAPLVLPGTLMKEAQALSILAAQIEAQKAAGEATPS
jgi:hypothetical protein